MPENLASGSFIWFTSLVYCSCYQFHWQHIEGNSFLIPGPISCFRFAERGKIFTKQEVRAIQIGPNGLFFTGDGTGQVRVWNWIAEPATSIQ